MLALLNWFFNFLTFPSCFPCFPCFSLCSTFWEISSSLFSNPSVQFSVSFLNSILLCHGYDIASYTSEDTSDKCLFLVFFSLHSLISSKLLLCPAPFVLALFSILETSIEFLVDVGYLLMWGDWSWLEVRTVRIGSVGVELHGGWSW